MAHATRPEQLGAAQLESPGNRGYNSDIKGLRLLPKSWLVGGRRGWIMANLGGMSLSTFRDGTAAARAASFDLVKAPREHHYRTFLADGWEAELRQGLERVVVRSKCTLADGALLDEAINLSQEFLDLVSVTAREHLLVKAPADVAVLMFSRDDSVIIQHRDVIDFGMMVSAKIEVWDAHGNVKQSPPLPEPQWSPAFRYYRTSQTANDLFEAYRNLYLAFEAVLAVVCPKGPRENERRWLARAIGQAGTQVELSGYGLPGQDAIESLVATQYKAIRCKLFHAKPGDSILPHELPSHIEVTRAYEQLVHLWEDIARSRLSVRLPSGGLTYHGFKLACDGFMPKLKMWITADDTSFNKADDKISPRGLPCYPFATHRYLSQQYPGRAALVASVPVGSLPHGQVVGRVVGRCGGKVYLVSHISGGLGLEGANELETIQVARLVNPKVARSIFP